MKLLPLFFSLLLFFASAGVLFAQNLSEVYNKKTDEIRELEKKLGELVGQSRTLSSQITNFNTQIRLTELKIDQTREEIASLAGKIGKLETTIEGLSSAYEERVINIYRLRRVGDPLVFALTSQDFPQLLSRIYYLRKVADHDQKLLVRLQTSQTSLEVEKKEQEALEKKLEEQTALLSRQKGAKEKLLELTRNDEKKYQELLSKARAEQAAIAGAMRNAVNLLKNGQPIKRGETIALIGNSGAPGCSTGPHLHFEVQKDSVSVNPAGYLSSRDVIWDNAPDGTFSFTGQLPWPIESPRITQGFGMTHWASTGFYRGNPHTGIDMTSTDITIHSPVDGTLYKGTVSCGSSPMNFVAVDHGGGMISWYWHVQ